MCIYTYVLYIRYAIVLYKYMVIKLCKLPYRSLEEKLYVSEVIDEALDSLLSSGIAKFQISEQYGCPKVGALS